MTPSSLQKVLALIKKTGDTCIVLSPDNDEFVLLSIDSYERLAKGYSDVSRLSEEELLDKINRDIAFWKAEQEYATEIPEAISAKETVQLETLHESPYAPAAASAEDAVSPQKTEYRHYEIPEAEIFGEDDEEDAYYFESIP